MSSYSTQQQWSISQSNCDVWWKVDFMWQLAMRWLAQLSDQEKAPKYFPKQTCTNKVVTIWSSAISLTHYSFLNHHQNHYIWEVCSANQWDCSKTAMPAADTGHENVSTSPWQCPTTHHTTSASKVEQIGLWNFASSTIFTWPLTNWLPLLQASRQCFACSQPAGSRKYCPRVQWISKHEAQIFMLQE